MRCVTTVTGEFGNICHGHLKVTGRPAIPVIIETLGERATEADRVRLMTKASMMRRFDDVNIVYLHGVVISSSSPQLVVTEHLKYGPLLNFIRVPAINNKLHGFFFQKD